MFNGKIQKQPSRSVVKNNFFENIELVPKKQLLGKSLSKFGTDESET